MNGEHAMDRQNPGLSRLCCVSRRSAMQRQQQRRQRLAELHRKACILLDEQLKTQDKSYSVEGPADLDDADLETQPAHGDS